MGNYNIKCFFNLCLFCVESEQKIISDKVYIRVAVQLSHKVIHSYFYMC